MHASATTGTISRPPILSPRTTFDRLPRTLWLQDSVNWRHRMVHLAVPSGLFAVWVNFERGGLGEYRSDSFRGLDTTDVSADAIALSKSEGEVGILLLSSSIEGMRALPSLRIAVCKRRDQVYGIASTHTLPAELDILPDDAAHRSERRQKPQALFDEACHEWGIPTQLRLQLLIPTQCVQKASQEGLRLIVQAAPARAQNVVLVPVREYARTSPPKCADQIVAGIFPTIPDDGQQNGRHDLQRSLSILGNFR